MRVDYHRPGATWVDEAKSWDAARRLIAANRRCGVVAYPVQNEDGTWRVEMVA